MYVGEFADIADMIGMSEAELVKLSPEKLAYILWQSRWISTARPEQIPPESGWTEIGYQAGRGYGKLIDVNTSIPTPSGWTLNGDLKDGDLIFDERGQQCRVVKAHEPVVPETMYRLTFSDGEAIDAGGEHLWMTLVHRDRKQMIRNGVVTLPPDWATFRQPLYRQGGAVVGSLGAEVRTTEQIRETLNHSTRRDLNHCIPIAQPPQTPEADLCLDPYVLGLWLGDGSSKAAEITCSFEDLPFYREELAMCGYSMGASIKVQERSATYPISNGAKRRYCPSTGQNRPNDSIYSRLKELEVFKNKHAPATYLRASPAQRLALLQGLMDSDGTVANHCNQACFDNMNERLADAVYELVVSLGMKASRGVKRATLYGKDCGTCHRVIFRPTIPVFRLPRKLQRLDMSAGQSWRHGHRMVVSVEPIEPVLSRCITVDSPSRLYLAGRGMIPTHNTRVGAEWLGRAAWEDPKALPSCVIAPTFGDVRFTCFEGVSGLCNVIPPELISKYNSSDSILVLNNGAIIRGFSAEKPERLRGPEHCRIWMDEVAAWGPTGLDVWNMAQFGLRLGTQPQILWTSTPKPVELVRKLIEPKPKRIIVRGATYDNKANLAESFFENVAQYEGTTLGRQELEGELIDPEEAGILKRSWFKLWPSDKPLPSFSVIIMSLDTAFTEKTNDVKTEADPTACGVFGVFDHDKVKNLMLLDCWSEHLSFPDLLEKVKHESKTRYGDDREDALVKPLIGSAKMLSSGRKADIILVEEKGSGISLRQSLAAQNIIAYPYNPGKADKLTRLHIVSPLVAKRRVWLPESGVHKGKPRNWVEPFLAQVCAFVGEGSIKHDDYVDVFSQAARLCLDKGFVDVKDKDAAHNHRDAKGREPPDKRPERRMNPYAS